MIGSGSGSGGVESSVALPHPIPTTPETQREEQWPKVFAAVQTLLPG